MHSFVSESDYLEIAQAATTINYNFYCNKNNVANPFGCIVAVAGAGIAAGVATGVTGGPVAGAVVGIATGAYTLATAEPCRPVPSRRNGHGGEDRKK